MSWHQNKLMIQCCNKHTLMDLSVTSDGKPATETFFERIEGVLLANFKTWFLCLSAILWAVNLDTFNWCKIWALLVNAAGAFVALAAGDLLLPALWKEMLLPLEPLTVFLLAFFGVLALVFMLKYSE